MFSKAIVRPPSANFAAGLTTATLGVPNYERAIEQHEAYCVALERCGLSLLRLQPDAPYPDATFLEDAAVLTKHGAIVTRPGAKSREGEVESVREALAPFFPSPGNIRPPGTVDGGDICQAESHFFIGISQRTNEQGAEQLAAFLSKCGYTSSTVDIRRVEGILHLKSGLASLGDNRLVVIAELTDRCEFAGYQLTRVSEGNEYAANCVRINDWVLVAAGYPRFESKLRDLGYQTIALDMSEFQKMDGGLSCLSLRF